MKNTLYFGDNLDVLRRYVADESIDLVYLDPPFNSDANYNVLFAEHDGTQSAAQIRAFEDTWQWDETAARAYQEVVECGGRVADAMMGFRTVLHDSDMLAYLSMMAPRLKELHRVLKPTGSIYLHCDDVASHYLKMLLDSIFGATNFQSQIVWKRTSAHGNVSVSFADVADMLLYYTKSEKFIFNKQYTAYSEEYLRKFYRYTDENGRRYRLDNLRNPGVRPNLRYDYKGYKPHPNGWAMSLEKMEKLDAEGRLQFPKDPNGRISLKRYLDEMPGVALSNIWDDIRPIGAQAAERLGYPTQKPEALLDRIILASSNEGDVVLDPFCGCGTAVSAAQRLNRRWTGIDITALAVSLIKHRLATAFGDTIKDSYEVIGEPVSLADAQALAEQDKYQFQWWALGLVNARPVEQKKGADKGIDGRILFHDEHTAGQTKQIILSVKGGHLQAGYVRDLRGVIEREKAAIGVLIAMEEPTNPMRKEAASAGFYKSPFNNQDYPKLQILTVEELLNGKGIDAPMVKDTRVQTIKRAPKAKAKATHRQQKFAE